MLGWMGFLLLIAIGMFASLLAASRFGSKPRQGHPSLIFRNCCSLWPDAWLAIKGRDVFAVQTALRLHNPRPCSWLEGFTDAERLFISPPVKGWILVTGVGLPRPRQDVDACFCFLLGLSRKLGQVQLFIADRTLHFHAWVKARNGSIVRAYAWAGTTLWQQGRRTRAETRLGLTCFEYTEPPQDGLYNLVEAADSNVGKVPLLAAQWGLDPKAVQAHFPLDEHGVTGKVACRHW